MSNSIESILESVNTWSVDDLYNLNQDIVSLYKSKKKSLSNALKQDLVIGDTYSIKHRDCKGQIYRLEEVNRTKAIVSNIYDEDKKVRVSFSLLIPCDSPTDIFNNYWDEQKDNISAIARGIIALYGDKGSCVMGMKLSYNGKQIADQICQGSLTNEKFFNQVIEHYVSEGKDKEQFHIEHGMMD
tara:strand:+ start:476 stop:1030 length:555 start_codon:yes stop_codon:yes gene_type:complete